MRTNRRQKREELFNRYTKNLSFYAPRLSDIDVSDCFICPVCFKIFPRSILHSALSLSHVVPHAAGGRMETLACSQCDNGIGHTSDRQQADEKKFAEFCERKGSLPGCIKDRGTRFNGKLCWGTEGPEFTPTKRTRRNPKWNEFLQRMDAAPESGNVSGLLYNRKELRRSVAYSAYLMMFYTFGYEYVLSKNAQLIRSIVGGESSPAMLESAMAGMPPSAFPRLPQTNRVGVSVVNQPTDKRCFIVVLPSPYKEQVCRGVLLPGFGEDGRECYERILKSDARIENMNIRFWLTRPYGRLDDPKKAGFAHYLWKQASICRA
jgi:hypothetical protein